MPRAGMTGVIEHAPNAQTIYFHQGYVNLSALARRCRVTPSHISGIFSGRRKPSLILVKKMALVFGCDIDTFLTVLDQHIYKKVEPAA